MDVSQLSDAELRDSLKSYGVSTGPIVASTRKLYEKKLIKEMGATNNHSINGSVIPDLDNSQIDSSPESQNLKESPVFTKKTPAKVFQEPPAEVSNLSDSDDCEESMRYLTEEEMAADRAARRQAQSGSNKSGGFLGNTITLTVLFIIIAVFAYFLIENAEQFKLLAETNSEDTI